MYKSLFTLSVREKRFSSKEDVTNSSQPNICANVRSLDGRDGRDGSPGPRGQPGRDGRDGQAGQLGPRGEPGPAGGSKDPRERKEKWEFEVYLNLLVHLGLVMEMLICTEVNSDSWNA